MTPALFRVIFRRVATNRNGTIFIDAIRATLPVHPGENGPYAALLGGGRSRTKAAPGQKSICARTAKASVE